MPGDITPGHTVSKASSDPTAFSIAGHVGQIGDMADAIRRDTKPLVDQYEGRKPIEIIMAIYESSRTGKVIEL